MKTTNYSLLGTAMSLRHEASSLPQSIDEHDIQLREASRKNGFLASQSLYGKPSNSTPNLNAQYSVNGFRSQYQNEDQQSLMSALEQSALTLDPIVKILAAFYSIPNDYRSDLFNDFREAAEAQDLRLLLDTISDWAATAELYAQPKLATELQDAIAGRREIADWLPG